MSLIDADELIKDRVENDNVYIHVSCAPTVNAIPMSVIEDIKAEIQANRDEFIKGQDAEWHTYNRCLSIIDKHIGG